MGKGSKLDWVWQARYGYWVISDEEFSNFDKEDYDKKAKRIKDSGINAVITWGYHFRWSWYAYWERLLEILFQVVQACHKYDIKVTEHHSAILMYYPQEKRLKNSRVEKVLAKEGVDLNRYPKTIKNIMEDFDIDGIPASTLNQIDIQTGNRSRMKGYHSHMMCFNNPLYRERYFKYLEKIYSTGVDGIMTDDIQFLPGLTSCGCNFCREKFKKMSGYELPPNGEKSPEFFDDPRNPALLAWIDFRQKSHIEHHQAVNKHFKSLGLELSRPNYSSSDVSVYGPCKTGYTLEGAMPFFTTAGTEMCFSDHNAFSWLWGSGEAKHRSALGRRCNAPALTIFYPRSGEEDYFEWALTKLWGQILWRAGEKEKTLLFPKGYLFEDHFPSLYLKPESLVEIGLLFSHRTRNSYYPLNEKHYVQEYRGWVETLFIENQSFDVILDEDLEEGRYLDRIKLLILPNCACLSELQIKRIKEFVSQGGNLIITYETGLYDEKGDKKDVNPFAELIGGEFSGILKRQSMWKREDEDILKDVDIYVDNRQPICQWSLENRVKVLITDNNYPVLFENKFGKGKVIYIAGKSGTQYSAFMPIHLFQGTAGIDNIPEYFQFDKRNPQMRKIMNQTVDYLLNRQIKLKNAAEGLLVSYYRNGKSIVIHLCNASGAFKKNGDVFSRQELPSFQEPATFSKNREPITIKIRNLPSVSRAIWRSPESAEERELPLKKDGEYIAVEIPSRGWRVYSVVEVS